MYTTRTTSSNRKRIALAIVAAAAIATSSAAAAQTDPPQWEHCTHRDHPVAADIGGILPTNFVPPREMQAALRGEIAVGTDCTFYDLPV